MNKDVTTNQNSILKPAPKIFKKSKPTTSKYLNAIVRSLDEICSDESVNVVKPRTLLKNQKHSEIKSVKNEVYQNSTKSDQIQTKSAIDKFIFRDILRKDNVQKL